MCRPTQNGIPGRRCPSHSNPALIAARNARRRASWAARTKTTPEGDAEKLAPSGEPVTEGAVPGSRIVFAETTFTRTNLTRTVPGTKLTAHENVGSLVDSGYFHKETITGELKPSAISTDNLTELGFTSIPKNEDGTFDDTDYRKTDEFDPKYSEAELANLTEDETAAINYYTSGSYVAFSKLIYKGKAAGMYLSEDDDSPTFEDGEVKNRYYVPSRRKVDEIVEALDTAISKGPKVQ